MFDIKSFYEAKDVKDAVEALVREPEAEVISGGTDVLIRVREGKDAGRALVSISNIKELKGVKVLENGDLWIGAATAFSHITNDPTIQKLVPMLGEAVDMVGGPQIRNTGTIGGNICNGATSADSAASMWTLNALIQLEGPEGHREVPIHEFYTGPGRTVRDRCEVCTGFIIKKEDYEGWYGQYIKYGKRKAMEIATLGCAVRVKLSADKKKIEDLLKGEKNQRAVTGIGLYNVNSRLKLLYGESYGLIYNEKVRNGFEIWVRLPKKITESEER